MSKPQARFEDLVEFPSLFVFRALGAASADLHQRCVRSVEQHLDRRVESVETAPSSKGAYVAVRVGVIVTSADEIRSTYDLLAKVEGIRMVL